MTARRWEWSRIDPRREVHVLRIAFALSNINMPGVPTKVTVVTSGRSRSRFDIPIDSRRFLSNSILDSPFKFLNFGPAWECRVFTRKYRSLLDIRRALRNSFLSVRYVAY